MRRAVVAFVFAAVAGTVHIEKDIRADGTFEPVKPSMVALGKALVATLL